MPALFPGMDPFLEAPEHFEELHRSLIVLLKAQVQPCLPEPYFAKSGFRKWAELFSRSLAPECGLSAPQHLPSHSVCNPSLLAALLNAVPIEAELIQSEELCEASVDVYTRQGQEKRLVTTIEVLTPESKGGNAEVRGKYLQKQREILASEVHLIEIDLLRAGRHTTAVPRDLLVEKAGPFDYHAVLHFFNEPKRFYAYPFRLEDRLPEIALPLLPGDPILTLDLQAAFNRAYDSGPYRREINYRAEHPDPPLTPEQQAWVARVLESAA